jgi:cellulose 1,4-beta-cellobiosidase
MDPDGGLSKHPLNKCGAKYGTGYCDAQCPHDMKFINGEANILDWKPSSNDPNSGTGHYGTCCTEMDIWESNSVASAVTPHVCTVQGQTRCEGTQCGDMPDNRYGGVCDKDGCDFNSWRMGNHTFFGPQMTVDTTKPFTVVTQFITNDNTNSGTLTKINRIYVQNGRVIQNSESNFSGLTPTNFITDEFCNDQKKLFGDRNDFEAKGGLRGVGQSWDRGMVLVMSLWDDHDVHMLWLDSDYPTTSPASQPGIARGSCSTSSGVPSDVESQYPNANVIYSNIKFGPIGSTF